MGPPRLSKKNILPTAVKSRGLGNVVKVSENAEASTSLNNGEDVVFTTLFVNDKKADFIVEPEFSLWQGSISFLNLLPGGSNVDPSEFQIIGPWNEWTEGAVLGLSGAFDIALPTYVSVSKIYVRNISAGASTTIIARARLRYITNFDKARLT